VPTDLESLAAAARLARALKGCDADHTLKIRNALSTYLQDGGYDPRQARDVNLLAEIVELSGPEPQPDDQGIPAVG
jgi:hypothetical protein